MVMMDAAARRKIVVNILEKAHKRADAEAAAIVNNPEPTFSFIYEHLRQYVLAKYLLPDTADEDDITRLAELSLLQSSRLDPKILKELDEMKPCDSMSSAATKKVLLRFSIKKNICKNASALELTNCRTVTELARVIFDRLGSGPEFSG